MRKELFYRSSSLGIIGECTGIYPKCGASYAFSREDTLKVGDVVSFYQYEIIYTKVIAKHELNGKYGIFGFGGTTLDFEKLTKVMSYKDVTEDIFRKLQEPHNRGIRENFTIRTAKPKEMSIEQIQEKLGYPIKIIGESR